MSKIQTLNESEIELLLIQLWKPIPDRIPRWRDVRNYTMGVLMLDAGLRCGELTNLLVADLLTQKEPVHSLLLRKEITKRGRSRLIPLTDRIKNAITQMTTQWHDRPGGLHVPWAFLSGPSRSRLTRRTVERIIKAAGIIALSRDIHPHILRHTFASRLMRTTNIRIVQELLGHVRLSSTQIYTHPNSVDLHNAINTLQKEENHG